jgi:hypothetical protein
MNGYTLVLDEWNKEMRLEVNSIDFTPLDGPHPGSRITEVRVEFHPQNSVEWKVE